MGNSSTSGRTLRYETHDEGDEDAYNALPSDLRDAFDGAVQQIKEFIPEWGDNIQLLPFGLRSHPGCPAQGQPCDVKPFKLCHLLFNVT